MSTSPNVPLVQVLGGIAYGEWKAAEHFTARAQESSSSELERDRCLAIAKQELGHHRAFCARLEALGADPDRAMQPYKAVLDAFHAELATRPTERALWVYLGEGIADDLLAWLETVADGKTAAVIAAVRADERGHEQKAADDLRRLLERGLEQRRLAARAVLHMVYVMARSGAAAPSSFSAYLKLGAMGALVRRIVGGYVRRLRAVGLLPLEPALLLFPGRLR